MAVAGYIEHVFLNMTMLCERWGASEEQVRELMDSDADLLYTADILAGGSPLFEDETVAAAEHILPDLARGLGGDALAAVREAESLADREYPRLPEGWRENAHEWQWKLSEERHACVARVLEARRLAATV